MVEGTGDTSDTARRGRAGGTAYLLAALVLLAVGAGGGLLLARLGTPDVLAAPTALSDLAVNTLMWDDPRPANLTLTMGAPQQVLAPRAGLLTASTCAPGGALRSGTVSFAVDGRPLLTLATSTPLWRDLPIGTSGADAAAVVAALRELGASVDGATVTASVIAAYDAVAKAAGAPASGGTIARDGVVWIPSAAATALTCDASVGGDAVLCLGNSNPIRDADLAPVPPDPAPVYANRGLSGIDGTIGTAVGVALATGSPTTLLLGDLAFVHDAGSLVIPVGEPRPRLRMVVADDAGGSIFATLEYGQPRFAEAFERVFATPTGLDLVALAAAYGVPAKRLRTAQEVTDALSEPVAFEVLVVTVDRAGRADLNRRINAG